jgi:hypothetical protein
MSRGNGKLQAKILDLLAGRGRREYRGAGPLDTGELVTELQTAGLVPCADRKAAVFRTYRAVRSLYWRGLVTAEATATDTGAATWTWSLAPPPATAPQKTK